MSKILTWLVNNGVSPIIPTFTDVVEIIILTVIIYQLMKWVKDTKAWTLLKGFAVLLIFIGVAKLLGMETIYWLAEKFLSLGITALLVVFQPELRKGLEALGQKNYFGYFHVDQTQETGGLFSDHTMDEIIKACYEMGKARTGALIVIERTNVLTEYEKTGIELDSIVSSQLLINIFEHNTPLHDGAVIVRGDRIVSATCYLPLSDNRDLSKELGTRHRAGVGISEATDSFTIIVSEETGKVSVAFKGNLERNVSAEMLRARMMDIQDKVLEPRKFLFWKGKVKDEEQDHA